MHAIAGICDASNGHASYHLAHGTHLHFVKVSAYAA
jgi:hypothetical protein